MGEATQGRPHEIPVKFELALSEVQILSRGQLWSPWGALPSHTPACAMIWVFSALLERLATRSSFGRVTAQVFSALSTVSSHIARPRQAMAHVFTCALSLGKRGERTGKKLGYRNFNRS